MRGKYSYLYQANMKNPIPFFISTNKYGIFVDNYSHMIFRDDEYGSYIYSETVDEMDYYFMNGNTFDEIIGCYRQLTGKAPMLPKWTFGYMQSRERYETQEETLNIAKEFRKREIPIDTIIMDWQSWEGNKWGQKSFDESRFPNPKEMIDYLHNENIKYMLSIWPNMNNLGPN